MNEPLVSIVIPVYNGGAYLRPSVESILAQTYTHIEILIIDDGSTDGSLDCVTRLNDRRIRILRKENGGRATALNLGLDEISGEFYATQDADDVSHPQRIERQVQCLLDDPDLAAVFTGHELILDGRVMAPRFGSKNREQCRRDVEDMRMPTLDPTGMFRVALVRDVRYETTLRVGAAYDYILRIGERHPMMVLGECLYSHRRHAGSVCAQDPHRERRMVRNVLERACQRRGLEPGKHLSWMPEASDKLTHQELHGWLITHFMESVLDLRSARRYGEALRTAFVCVSMRPYDLWYYKPFIYWIAPPWLVRCYRAAKGSMNRHARDTSLQPWWR